MRKILLGLSAALVLVPLLALAGLALGGVAPLRSWVERTAARVLDRPLAIEGDLALAWSLRPTLRAEGLVIGAKPGEAVDLARIGRLELRLALLPLLVGRLEVDRLRLADATVVLPADGTRRAERGAGVGHSADTLRERAPLPLRELLLERVRIELPASGDRPSRSLLLSRLEARLKMPEGPFELAAEGELDGRSATLELGLDSLQALLEGRPARVDRLAVELAGSDLAGTLDLDPGGPRPRLAGSLASRRLNLPALSGLLGGGEGRAPIEPAAGPGRDRRLIPELPIDLAILEAVEVELRLRVAELLTGGPILRDLSLPIGAASGRLHAEPLEFRLAEGRIGGRIEVDGGRSPPSLSVALEARDVALAALERELGREPSIEAPLDLDLELAGRGHSLRALAASLDGELVAAAGRGRLRTPALDRLAGGVAEAARALLGESAEGWVELRCAAFDLPVRAGRIEARVAVLETALARLSADGRIDLGSERLDLTLLPQSRGAALSVAVPFRVRGSLAAPEVALDQRDAARRAVVGLLGTLAFPPAAMAAFADLGAAGSPCLESQPAPAAGPVSRPGLPDADTLRRGLEELLGGSRRP